MPNEFATSPNEVNRKSPDSENQSLAKLLFLSFYFSQGDLKLQENIFKYIHLQHPDLQISSDSQFDDVLKMAQDQALSYIHKTSSTDQLIVQHRQIEGIIDPPHIAELVKQLLTTMKEAFQEISIPEKHKLLEYILAAIIRRDYLFLVTREGRERSQTTVFNPLKDKWLSQFVYYVIQKHETHSPEFDELFSDLRIQAKEALKTNAPIIVGNEQVLREVMDAYNQNHPQTTVDLAAFTSESNT